MLLQTFILSISQSITEFLPVSSSGHLILLPFLFGWQDQGISLDIGMHLGTLFAVVVYFFSDLWRLLIGLLKGGIGRKMVFLLLIGTLPILILGFFAGNCIEQVFRSPYVVCTMLMVFGVVLWLADKYGQNAKDMEQISYKDAFLIGVGQCLALVPGTSRSGITMTVARMCGVNRSDSARFSMLLSIPAIGAAGGWLLLRLWKNHQLSVLDARFFEGMFLCFIFGLAVIWFLMSWVKKHTFFALMVYRVLLGFVIIGLLLKN